MKDKTLKQKPKAKIKKTKKTKGIVPKEEVKVYGIPENYDLKKNLGC